MSIAITKEALDELKQIDSLWSDPNYWELVAKKVLTSSNEDMESRHDE